jgi:hypothetical protein
MVQLRFTAWYQTFFQSACTTVRFIIIGINYKSHGYNIKQRALTVLKHVNQIKPQTKNPQQILD